MSAVTLKLRQDYPNGLFGFFDAAEKAYGSHIYDAVEKCNATQWKAVKEIFLKDPNKPLFAEIAATLERAILAYPKR